jgi:hypothetical protein
VKKIGILSCLLLLSFPLVYALPYLGNHEYSSAAAGSSQSSISLTLVARPPVLPADKGTYPSLVLEFVNSSTGVPYIPQQNLVVQLSSTNPQTGSVSDSVLFPAGSLFVTANFTTTSSPSATTVNAFVAGYNPASTTVTTASTGGMPTSLQVYMSPSVTPPNALITSSVIVMMFDQENQPVKLGAPLTISLSSSNSQIGSVPQSLTIPAGSSFGVATFTPTYIAGQTSITASAPGVSTGSATMTTVGPIARRLVVTVGPSAILANGNDYATVAIQLEDNNSQTPAPAPSSVSVIVSSSNTSVGILESSLVTITKGQFYTTVTVRSGGAAGVTNITASAQGFIKGSSQLKADASSGRAPNQLSVSFVPNILLPNNQPYWNGVVVELEYVDPVTGAAVPAVNNSGTVTVYARSSNNATMSVDPVPIYISPGESHAYTPITSSFLPGSAFVTVQANNLTSDTEQLTSYGLAADSLSVSVGPQKLLADGESYNVTVGLLNNATGEPATAPVTQVVNLASTNGVVGGLDQSFVTIPAGQSFATDTFVSSGIPGNTSITASASNYATGVTNLTLVSPEATNLGIFAAPSSLIANGKTYENLVIELQDGSGYPQKTDVPVNVILSTNSISAGSVISNVTINPGFTFVVASFTTTNETGNAQVTAFANGFQSAKTNISSVSFPLSAVITLSSSSAYVGGRLNATVAVFADGQPLAGANVVWVGTTQGAFVGSENTTDSNGVATTYFMVGPVPATEKIVAHVSMLGYETVAVNSTVFVHNPVTTTTETQGNTNPIEAPVLGIPLWILLVVVAVSGGGGGFLYIRKTRGGGDYDYGEDE